MSYDVDRLRADFPALDQEVNGKPLAYLDNAASTQKPRAVLDALDQIYARDYSNIHRGVHQLSVRATTSYEAARGSVKRFLGASDEREIVFVRGATEAINLVAQTWGRTHIGAGDEVLITAMEHHSNIVPWQLLCESVGARLEVVDVDDRGQLDMDDLAHKLRPSTKLLSMVHVSNALGTINPVKEIVTMARERGIATLLDGAQATPHGPVDVQDLGCDFYVFSGHKVYGPTGIGVLYGRLPVLEAMPPWQGGGDMIETVSFEKSTYAQPPARFEAGTPHIAGAVGLGAACDYLTEVGLEAIAAHEDELLVYGTGALEEIDGLTLIGTAAHKAGVLSFVMEGIHPHDVGTILDFAGVAVRTGHHCTQPLMQRFGVNATTRASLGLYNTREEIDRLAGGLRKVVEMFR
ncbi:MAG: SufS family cysteine desulfurase [Myxococcota bacterium]